MFLIISFELFEVKIEFINDADMKYFRRKNEDESIEYIHKRGGLSQR